MEHKETRKHGPIKGKKINLQKSTLKKIEADELYVQKNAE